MDNDPELTTTDDGARRAAVGAADTPLRRRTQVRAGDRTGDNERLSARVAPLEHPDLVASALLSALAPDTAAARQRHLDEQDYYNSLYLMAPVGYFVIAFDTSILQVNLVGAEMLGIARAHPGGRHFRSYVCPQFLPDFDRFIGRALNSPAPERCSVQLACGAHSAGFGVTLLGSADGSGQACRLVVEPAEGKLAPLERSEERFRRIVHSAEEGIWEIDASACTTFVNPKMADMLGYQIEDMLGQTLKVFMDEEGEAIMARNLARRRQGIAERHDFKFIRKNGSELWATLATNPIVDAQGNYLGALALVTDVTEKKASTELIWRQANFDELTGLPNRHMFLDRLRQEMRKADRGDQFLALLFIDLDRFKEVNDQLGHAMGDVLLVETAARIAACIRGSDTLARLGGDEFTVILAGLDHVGSVERIAQNMIASLARPFALGEHCANVSASIGIALYPPDARAIDDLLGHADQAMYAAKNAGRNRYSYFTPDLQKAAQQRLRTASDLRAALAGQQFEIHYQPIVSLQTGAVHKAEALLRWRHPTRGLLNPAEFIPFAESSGLIVEIGDWVFRQAARQVMQWQQRLDPAFQISVNKSPVQFRRDAEQYKLWLAYLAELNLPPRSIVIEVAESILLDGSQHVVERLQELRSMGVQVALDNFGTGYSSLSYLKRFDIDFLKIDQSFVQQLASAPDDMALCEAIVVMAHKLGLVVVAEGVETLVQRGLLAGIGCDYAQGYAFAHPMPAHEFEAMVQSGQVRLAGAIA